MGSPSPLSREIVAAAGSVVAVVGAYGSGKTEISVNLALGLAATRPALGTRADHGTALGTVLDADRSTNCSTNCSADADRAARPSASPTTDPRVQLADLDLVNPYFRSREALQLMEAAGVRVVVPPGDQIFADLPIVLPEIAGLLHPPPGTSTVLDVGGDDVGARALAAFRPRIADGQVELWMVLNSRRPFSATTREVLAMRSAIETSSRLPVTGFVANSHLLDETTIEVVLEGWQLARQLSRDTGLPLRAVAVMGNLADDPALAVIDAPVMRLTRNMLPPWLVNPAGGAIDAANGAHAAHASQTTHATSATHHHPQHSPHPAPRALPIGRPDHTTSGDHHG